MGLKKSKKNNKAASQSVYAPGPETQQEERHTLAIVADNQPGVLARIVGLFSGRGYNIESITAAETDHDEHVSRITIICNGTPQALEQIKTQIEQVVAVRSVRDLTTYGDHVEREMALVKVVGEGDNRIEALRIADIFKAHPVDTTATSFVFEITADSNKVDDFIELMKPLGLVDVSRSGIAAISRGTKAIGDD